MKFHSSVKETPAVKTFRDLKFRYGKATLELSRGKTLKTFLVHSPATQKCRLGIDIYEGERLKRSLFNLTSSEVNSLISSLERNEHA